MAKKVLVTGGSGFLGHHVIKLISTHWKEIEEIHVLDICEPKDLLTHQRSGANGFHHFAGKIIHVPGSISNLSELKEAFRGIDAVIHCAAIVENGSSINRKMMYDVNVTGTSNVIEACVACGVKVLVATGSVYQFLTKGCKLIDMDEKIIEPPLREALFPEYSFSKIFAEKLVLTANGRNIDSGKLRTCVLRCPGMYGERDRHLVPKMISNARVTFSYYVRNEKNKFQTMYAGNAAWAHVMAAKSLFDDGVASRVSGKAYFLSDDTPDFTGGAFFGSFLDELGYKRLPFTIPYILMLLFGYIVDLLVLVLAFLSIDICISLGAGAVQSYLNCDYKFSSQSARKDFQYKPLFSYKEAFDKSLLYYRQNYGR